MRSGPLPPILVLVAALVAVVLLAAGGGKSTSGRGSGPVGSPVAAFIDELAAPWPKLQLPQGVRNAGQYREPVSGGTRYGDALMGYTEILTGLRTHRPELFRSGLRALRFGVARSPKAARPSVFEVLSAAAAYNLARRHLVHEPLFAGQRPMLEAFLRRARLLKLPATGYFGNHWLVEAVEVRELLRTGLRSTAARTVLGGQRALADRLSRDLIDTRIPAMARAGAVSTPIGPAFVLSDPPDNPLVYQGLSLGFYARAVQLLGGTASPAARETLVKIARASLLVTAPDGDLAYSGRNQEECWGLAATALGAWQAAALHESKPELDAQLRALAERSIRRLRTVYRVGRYGLNYTPIVGTDPAHALRALDPGAGGASFAGLAQLVLEWARPVAIPAPRGATIPADHPLHVKLSHGESRFLVVRHGRFWYALRPATSGKHPDDIRADFGLIAFKSRQASGGWRDVSHLRPFTRGGPPNSAGPLLRTGGLLGLPFASRARLAESGAASMTLAWRGAPTPHKYFVATPGFGHRIRALGYRSGPVYRGGVPLSYTPTPCGLRLSVLARRGDTIEYSVFLTGSRTHTGPLGVSDDRSRTTFSHPAHVSLEGPYYSAVESGLVRARLTFAKLPAGPLEITTCARP